MKSKVGSEGKRRHAISGVYGWRVKVVHQPHPLMSSCPLCVMLISLPLPPTPLSLSDVGNSTCKGVGNTFIKDFGAPMDPSQYISFVQLSFSFVPASHLKTHMYIDFFFHRRISLTHTHTHCSFLKWPPSTRLVVETKLETRLWSWLMIDRGLSAKGPRNEFICS